jgi:hypothetical protein
MQKMTFFPPLFRRFSYGTSVKKLNFFAERLRVRYLIKDLTLLKPRPLFPEKWKTMKPLSKGLTTEKQQAEHN